MIKVLSTNITSPLGYTTEQNFQALKSGCSALLRYDSWNGLPEPFVGSIFTEEQNAELSIDGFTRFESLIIRSVSEALQSADVDVKSERTLLVISTTKANIEELGAAPDADGAYLHPGDTAKKIAQYIGVSTPPFVVSNACISGVSAQIIAKRLIDAGMYDTAIVCGCDCITPFIVTGFQSFKALSAEPCRPFDIERIGLNIGEAASTIILQRDDSEATSQWVLETGCANNDAYHLSAPSPVGDGTNRALRHCIEDDTTERLGVISVHGTATMFNDQMESKAIENAGLSSIPLSALKGYYGHTMGAAGIIETVITMRALDDGCILPSRGFEEIGVSGKVDISNEERTTDKRAFLKIISGFGGCNGALLFSKGRSEKGKEGNADDAILSTSALHTTHSVRLDTSSLYIDNVKVETTEKGKALLTQIYKTHIGDYPKFYKMDMLSRVAFVASELLIAQDAKAGSQEADIEETDNAEAESRAVILFNRTSSIVSDRKHVSTICNKDEFFPSPSIFLYTLPNIMTGEIAIKHGYKGETSLYILEEKNEQMLSQIITSTMQQSGVKSILTGWVDCSDENEFEADIRIITK